MKKLFIAIATCLILVGCATQAVKISDAKNVPDDRVFFKNEAGDGAAEVVIIRDSGFMSSGCYIQLFIDGNLSASIDPSEKVSFKVKEGRHMFGATTQGSKGLCNFGDGMQEREFALNSGEKRYYRAFIDANGLPMIIPTTQAH